MLKSKSFATLTVAVGLVAVLPAVASAAWTKSGVAAGTAAATSVQAPSTATAAPTSGSTSTSITVSWTAPSSGPTPTGYRVDRVSPAATVCTVPAATLTCNDAGRSPATSYNYNVYALIQAWDGNATAASTSTSAGADTTAPVVAADCPTATSYATGNNGSNSWGTKCSDVAKVTATDSVGVISVAIKVQKSTACFTGTVFTVAQCTATGPSGYPQGYIAASNSSGNTWSVPLTQARLVTAATGNYTLSAQAKDAAGNTSSTLSVAFSTT